MKLIRTATESWMEAPSCALAAACVERQWPVYAIGSKGRSWEMSSTLRMALDSVWKWLEAGSLSPSPQLLPDDVIHQEILSDADALCQSVAISISALVESVAARRKTVGYEMACENITLLDSYVYEISRLPVSAQSDAFVGSHPLLRIEIDRQLEDVRTLDEDATREVIERVHMRSTGLNILGNDWQANRGWTENG